MELGLKGKRVVVAGGSKGIGKAIAIAFAEEGAAVSICARGADALEAAKAEIARHGAKAHAASCDLADAKAIDGYVAAAAVALGGIDILINNASGFGRTDDEAGWGASVAIDIMATVRASQAALLHLEKAKGGAIVNISSISAFRPSTRTPPYGAAKAAIVHYTATQAAMYAAKNVRVNCIAPGSIEFPGGTWDLAKKHNKPLYDQIFSRIPFGRLGAPEEVAAVAVFLASNAARWVTGQTISVDGGQLLT